MSKINVTESDVDDEFSEAATVIILGIVAKGNWHQNWVPDESIPRFA